ncbi:MAG: pyridoxal 5'-phosphate synthase glutaminase subunit PdxT [Clostridiales bacterium]|nr:pyridoxal 5'-phosphate synthase glutaminase subunit PdxT [Eubacteriales bacterium]MDH7565799.1 pyridoxal 5'-phosphate synthase glutaminase subunit PdxT [Clostridiales bacterium]
MINIGVLALQGSIAEHVHSLSMIEGITPCEVKSASDLEKISGLILPGGESTTIGKLIKDFALTAPIIKRAKEGMPIWGTCAGMILMAKEIVNEGYVHLGIMDIAVRRNAYGSQLDSFNSTASIPIIAHEDIPLVFIRAPWVETAGEQVRILARVNHRIAAVQQDNMLATSFHPELTTNLAFHKYFTGMVKKYLICG